MCILKHFLKSGKSVSAWWMPPLFELPEMLHLLYLLLSPATFPWTGSSEPPEAQWLFLWQLWALPPWLPPSPSLPPSYLPSFKNNLKKKKKMKKRKTQVDFLEQWVRNITNFLFLALLGSSSWFSSVFMVSSGSSLLKPVYTLKKLPKLPL